MGGVGYSCAASGDGGDLLMAGCWFAVSVGLLVVLLPMLLWVFGIHVP